MSTSLRRGHMETSVVIESPGRRTHRRHSIDFKVKVVQACRKSGLSIASVALANGLSTNMLGRWVVVVERGGAVAISNQGSMTVSATTTSDLPAFVAVRMPAPPATLARPVGIPRGRAALAALASEQHELPPYRQIAPFGARIRTKNRVHQPR